MYIGKLEDIEKISYTHEGTDVPFLPEETENGPLFRWGNVYDSAIDMHVRLSKTAYIGAVCLTLPENSVCGVDVLADGKTVGTYSAETGRLTGGAVTVPVGVGTDRLTVRLYTSLADVLISDLEILGAREDDEPFVWPCPKGMQASCAYAPLGRVQAASEDEDEVFAAAFLRERIGESFSLAETEGGVNILFQKDTSAAYAGERFTVSCEDGKLTVKAASRLALLYGATTVLSNMSSTGVRPFSCDDRPDKELRGFHMGLPRRDRFEFVRRLFRYVLLPLRYNMIMVQFTAAMRFDRHPEINRAWADTVRRAKAGELPNPPHMALLADGEILEKEEVASLLDCARELGFEIVPEVQSLGHVQYITIAYPELAEIEEKEVSVDDTRKEDERPAAVYHHCYCPSDERVYSLIYDIIDEVVEIARPQRYVHIGHDEVYQIGVCKRCKGKDPAKLLAHHICALYDHIKGYGLKTMMWADMLQPVTLYKTPAAIDMIPKDILMLDFIWYFHTDKDVEDNLLDKGFTVAVGNLYSSHFPRYSSRIKKKGVIGGEVSTWVEVCEEVYANNGKMWELMYLSEMLWNADRFDARNRRAYTDVIARKLQPDLRDLIRGTYSEKGYAKTSIPLPAPRAEALPAALLAALPEARVADGLRVAVGKCCDRMVLLHATLHSAPRIVWRPFEKIGDYTVEYADGERIEIPVKYAENILVYNAAYGEPMPQPYYRHNGYVGTWLADPLVTAKAGDGTDVTALGFVWDNPRPDKEIAAVSYRAKENDYCVPVLGGLLLQSKR